MPHYYWTGINLSGTVVSGDARALTVDELEKHLRERDVGLMAVREKRRVWSRCSRNDLLFFFEQLSVLLQSGVLLPQALSLVAKKIRSSRLAEIVEELQLSVERGVFLHEAMAAHPTIFDRLIIHVWRVGVGGDMRGAITLLCDYMRQRNEMNKKLKSAIVMPTLSLSFFVVIFCGVLFFIVPRFGQMFSSLKVEIPSSTKYLLAFAEYVRGWVFWVVMAVLCVLIYALWSLRRVPWIKLCVDSLLLKIPYIHSCIIERDSSFFFNALALLVQAGVQVVPAMELAGQMINNESMREHYRVIRLAVQRGSSMSAALEEFVYKDDDVIALVAVGEKSGRYGQLLKAIAKMFDDRIQARIGFLLHIVQPLLILVLALMIVGLMLAVYLPIFTLSYSM
jgi:type IV pilus assembly protein PilC